MKLFVDNNKPCNVLSFCYSFYFILLFLLFCTVGRGEREGEWGDRGRLGDGAQHPPTAVNVHCSLVLA